jgi:co-chaperonin GroES (HSP10)
MILLTNFIKMKNDSGIDLLWKDDVLIYIGDREFFRKKIAGGLFAPDESIDRAISQCVEGIVIQIGKDAFKDSSKTVKVGDKVMFHGHYGSIFSKKHPIKSDATNRKYFRIIKGKDFTGFCKISEEFESFI